MSRSAYPAANGCLAISVYLKKRREWMVMHDRDDRISQRLYVLDIAVWRRSKLMAISHSSPQAPHPDSAGHLHLVGDPVLARDSSIAVHNTRYAV